MTAIAQFTQRQRDILAALAQGTRYPFRRDADLVQDLQDLKHQGLIRERLGSSIGYLPDTGSLELYIVLTQQGKTEFRHYIYPSPSRMMKQRHKGKHFIEQLGNNIDLDMILIRGGTFTMGSPDGEEGRKANEGPQHSVTVPTFLMGRYPVTQAQWRHVFSFAPVNPEISFPPDPSRFKDKDDSDERPVEQVSWYQAKEFCDRLSVHTNRTYRLPSEAEWEYACRAGTTTPFSYGNYISTDIATFIDSRPNGQEPQATAPVNQSPIANPWGLCDMHGNVDEWCLDHWYDSYEGAPTDASPRRTKDPDRFVVMRGGAWNHSAWYCRSAFRNHTAPELQDYALGFRICLSLPRRSHL